MRSSKINKANNANKVNKVKENLIPNLVLPSSALFALFTLFALFAFSLFAHADHLSVVTTTEDLAAITREVGGSYVDVRSIAKGFQNPHYIEPKPSFMRGLHNADLFIQVGLDLEIAWAPLLREGARNPKILPGAEGYLDASVGCQVLEKPTDKVDRSKGDIHLYGNPHYWLDPDNGTKMAASIAKKLGELDAGHSMDFQKNLETFKTKLQNEIKKWKTRAASYQGTKIVSYHNSWPNFAKAFGFNIVGFVEPKPGIPPSPAHLAELIDFMRKEKIKIIVMEPYFDTRDPEFVAQRANAKVVLLTPSVGGAPDVKNYFDLFDHNLTQLENAFKVIKDSANNGPWILGK